METLNGALKKLKSLVCFNTHNLLGVNSKPSLIPVYDGPRVNHVIEPGNWMIELIKIIYKLKKGAFIAFGIKTGKSLLTLKAINRELYYMAFELNQHYVRYVEELIKSNDFINIKIFPFGISAITYEEGKIKFRFFIKSQGDFFQYLDDEAVLDKKESCKDTNQLINFTITENIVPQEVGIIEMRVEGNDLSMLQKTQELIMQKRPFLLLKILNSTLEESTTRLQGQDLAEKFFTKHNYRVFRIIQDTNKNLNYIELLGPEGNLSDAADIDYVIVPVELEAKFGQAAAKNGYVQKTGALIYNAEGQKRSIEPVLL